MNNRKKGIVLIFILSLITISIIVVGQVGFNKNNHVAMSSSTEANEEIEISPDKIYVYSINNKTTVYIKSGNDGSNKYIGYQFENFKKNADSNVPASNFDVWKLSGANVYDLINGKEFRSEREIVKSGEWELAIKENGANDFIGGTAHGDEITTDISFQLDGEDVKTGKFINQEADSFQISSESELYRDNTITEELEVVGTHEKIYTFNKDGLTLEQKVTFNQAMNLDRSYLTMLPILRDNQGEQVTDTYVIEDEEQEFDVSDNDFEQMSVEASKASIFGSDSGITATVEITDKTTDIPTMFFVSNSESYNKLYFSYNHTSYQTEVGEVWEQTTHYDIDTVD